MKRKRGITFPKGHDYTGKVELFDKPVDDPEDLTIEEYQSLIKDYAGVSEFQETRRPNRINEKLVNAALDSGLVELEPVDTPDTQSVE